jgi:hypothetical protein
LYEIPKMEIHIHKSALMHHLLMCVARGYTRHAGGMVTAKGITGLVANMERVYGCNASASKRWHDRQKGLAGCRLFVHPDYDPAKASFHWWLMLTEDGSNPAIGRERMFDAHDKRHRLTVFNQFEAVQLTAPQSGPRWTWRITADYLEVQKERIKLATRRPDDCHDLAGVLRSIHRFPGFREVRNQVGDLRVFAAAEWQRSKPFDGPDVPLPNRVQGYVAPKVFPTRPLAEVRDRLLAGLAPFTVAERQGKEADAVLDLEVAAEY